jgi:hypothetical protein
MKSAGIPGLERMVEEDEVDLAMSAAQEASFYSPLSPAECERRLKAATMNRYLATWLVILGGGPELFGKVKSVKIRLLSPVIYNRSVVILVATLQPGDNGGTMLSGAFRRSFGWSTLRGASRDVRYLVQALNHVARFSEVTTPA